MEPPGCLHLQIRLGWPCQRRKERIENWSLTDLNPETAKKFERLERMSEWKIERTGTIGENE